MTQKIFVDTNYFLRLLLDDNLDQSTQAKELFLNGARGKIKLFTSSIVFFEIFWVLKSFYKKEKSGLVITLTKILKMNFIELTERDILLKAVELYAEKNLDLEDCYNVVFSIILKADKFMTFDVKLSRIIKEN